jgi:hypothetical protein
MAKQARGWSFSAPFTVELSQAGAAVEFLFEGFMQNGLIVCNNGSVAYLCDQQMIRLSIGRKDFVIPVKEISSIKSGSTGRGNLLWKHP